ncbi:Glycosyl transferase [Artemisia annua]|uniref:Alpha-1,4 glucan phosphorylase n=1 Tax=Artemisia annua TaxID=35608 RepID=A0A2U1KKS1_ARTAN|nr:Glycosyl transferase [Artemisia annua]
MSLRFWLMDLCICTLSKRIKREEQQSQYIKKDSHPALAVVSVIEEPPEFIFETLMSLGSSRSRVKILDINLKSSIQNVFWMIRKMLKPILLLKVLFAFTVGQHACELSLELFDKLNVEIHQWNRISLSCATLILCYIGRALLNAIGNLELSGAYAESLTKLGHDLDDIARQPDATLGNGGLDRLASYFLDSLAPLNYPAWGYGLHCRHGLLSNSLQKTVKNKLQKLGLEDVL